MVFTKLKKLIQNHPPTLGQNEKYFVRKALEKGEIALLGSYIKNFKNSISKFIGAKYVNLVSNGTSAIHLALLAAGVNHNDEVIVPSFTFIGSCNPILYCGARPIFFDVNEFHCINEKQVINFIKKKTIFKRNNCYNKSSKKIIKAIIIVHMWGNAAKIDKLIKLCKKNNIKVIEDAAESLGTSFIEGKYKNKLTGTIGDIGCLSFNSNKIVTTAGGGAVLTKNKKTYDLIESLKNQGRKFSKLYDHEHIGYNYNLSNIQSAIGYAQIQDLNKKIDIKKKIFFEYKIFFNNNENFELLHSPRYSKSNFWMNILKIKNHKINKKKLITHFKNNKIEIRDVWRPCHIQPKFTQFMTQKLDKTDEIYKKCICLPSGFNLTKNKIKKICKTFSSYESMFNN